MLPSEWILPFCRPWPHSGHCLLHSELSWKPSERCAHLAVYPTSHICYCQFPAYYVLCSTNTFCHSHLLSHGALLLLQIYVLELVITAFVLQFQWLTPCTLMPALDSFPIVYITPASTLKLPWQHTFNPSPVSSIYADTWVIIFFILMLCYTVGFHHSLKFQATVALCFSRLP